MAEEWQCAHALELGKQWSAYFFQRKLVPCHFGPGTHTQIGQIGVRKTENVTVKVTKFVAGVKGHLG